MPLENAGLLHVQPIQTQISLHCCALLTFIFLYAAYFVTFKKIIAEKTQMFHSDLMQEVKHLQNFTTVKLSVMCKTGKFIASEEEKSLQ